MFLRRALSQAVEKKRTYRLLSLKHPDEKLGVNGPKLSYKILSGWFFHVHLFSLTIERLKPKLLNKENRPATTIRLGLLPVIIYNGYI